MPIRVVKDKDRTSPTTAPDNGGGGGSPTNFNPGCLTALLPMLMKNPKMLIILAVIGIGVYLVSPKTCQQVASNSGLFTLGADLNEKMYDQAEVFEPLADNTKNPLPERFSLEQYAPRRLNQGRQGSCVGWASAYSARSIMHAMQTGINPDKAAFSPAFLYNQIGLQGCQGSYIIRAMENMNQVGSLPFNEFPYNDNECSTQPQRNQLSEASQFKTKGFNRLSKSGDNLKTDLLAIKQNLVQGAPVVIGMMVGGTFMEGMLGKKVWIPERNDYSQRGFGGHCMSVIGYDDYLEGGAFQIMNSWGPEWGENGIGWVRYKDFDYFTKEAYGLYPMGNVNAPVETNKIDLELGLVVYDDNTGNLNNLPYIPLKYINGNTYSTRESIAKGTVFKAEVTNSTECYTYIFAKETDESVYVIFPYTPKHSPYCGIVGTRLFPKDHSFKADELGNKDLIALVVTKSPIDYKALNEKINSFSGQSFEQKIKNALANMLSTNVSFSDRGNNLKFSGNLSKDQAIVAILEIDKR